MNVALNPEALNPAIFKQVVDPVLLKYAKGICALIAGFNQKLKDTHEFLAMKLDRIQSEDAVPAGEDRTNLIAFVAALYEDLPMKEKPLLRPLARDLDDALKAIREVPEAQNAIQMLECNTNIQQLLSAARGAHEIH